MLEPRIRLCLANDISKSHSRPLQRRVAWPSEARPWRSLNRESHLAPTPMGITLPLDMKIVPCVFRPPRRGQNMSAQGRAQRRPGSAAPHTPSPERALQPSTASSSRTIVPFPQGCGIKVDQSGKPAITSVPIHQLELTWTGFQPVGVCHRLQSVVLSFPKKPVPASAGLQSRLPKAINHPIPVIRIRSCRRRSPHPRRRRD